MSGAPRPLCAVLFDLDGTLVTSELDFDAIRREAGIERMPILEYMASATPERRDEVNAILERHEDAAARRCRLAEGAAALFEAIVGLGLRSAIITRNSRRSVSIVTERHHLPVDAVIAREDAAPKPSPEPVLKACEALGVPPAEALMVGDFIFDIESGRAAGTRTALVRLPGRDDSGVASDVAVDSLLELLPVVQSWANGHGEDT